MIYKNMEVHNVAQLVPCKEGNSVSWLRIPKKVQDSMENESGKKMGCNATGVELRFVMKSDKVTLCLEAETDEGLLNTFHIFHGGIQGGWQDHELRKYVGDKRCDFVISKASNNAQLKRIAAEAGQSWDPEVIRVIFDRGYFKIVDIIGEVEPPQKEQKPQKTILAYGSSITHGSNSIDASHSWVSVLAHNLNMDQRNLGMAGSCAMEPEFVNYIAEEGEKGNWDIATLELGINVLNWEDNKIRERVTNTIRQIAGRNPQKPIFVISPFYCFDDFNKVGKAENWRKIISEVVAKENFSNVTLFNGLDLLGDMSLISADEVHPNIYGVQQIATRITELIKKHINQ